MHDLRQQIHGAQTILIALVVAGLGIALMVLSEHIGEMSSSWTWLTVFPLTEIGGLLFSTGLLGIGIDYLLRRSTEALESERLARVLTQHAPALRDAVIDGFAFEPADIARVSTPETLDRIITNGLAIRLGDAEFAGEIYDDLMKQAIGIPERLRDVRVSIRLSPLPAGRGTAKGRAPLFAVTMRWEYRLIPTYSTRRFVCTSDMGEFRDLAIDEAATSVWYFNPKGGLAANEQSAFEVLGYTVNGQPRPIRRSSKADSQTYSVTLGSEAMSSQQPIVVGYTYRSVIAADGHRFRFRVDQPTKGLSVELDYSDTDLDDVAVLDYISSGDRTRISRSPAGVPAKTVTVEFDGWAFPRSGLAFVWK